MAGLIMGAQGYQRSGKTLLMYKIAQNLVKSLNIPCYCNIIAHDKNFFFINSVDEIPFNFEPKIVFIDELYNGADAQNWKDLKSISIFINTLGKQNVLFLYTTIDFNMVYNRIRNQTLYAFLVKSDNNNIYYRMIDTEKVITRDFTVAKSPALFSTLNYDTNFVPLNFKWSMDNFNKKLIDYYKNVYPDIYNSISIK